MAKQSKGWGRILLGVAAAGVIGVIGYFAYKSYQSSQAAAAQASQQSLSELAGGSMGGGYGGFPQGQMPNISLFFQPPGGTSSPGQGIWWYPSPPPVPPPPPGPTPLQVQQALANPQSQTIFPKVAQFTSPSGAPVLNVPISQSGPAVKALQNIYGTNVPIYYQPSSGAASVFQPVKGGISIM